MKKQMKKRILSTILVLSMVISIFLPVNNLVYATSTNKNLFICNSTLSSAHFVDEKHILTKRATKLFYPSRPRQTGLINILIRYVTLNG